MSSPFPDGWSVVEFENFTTLQRGKDLTKAEFREGTIPVAGSNGVIGYHDTAIAKAPGITVGRSGSAGKVTVYEEDFWPHNTSLYVRDFHGNDPHFAGFLLGSLNLAQFKTGASVPTLDRNSFKTHPILVPPLPEQKKIAHILSTVQRAIEAQERIIAATTELKKALMHKVFTEGLRGESQKQTEIAPVPESWEVVPLRDCAVVQTGIAKGRKVKVQDAVEVPYLRVANVQDGYLDLSEMKTITIRKDEQRRFALQNGDVVLTEGGDFDKLGRGFTWHGQINNCVHQNHVFAVRPDTSRISSEFFAYQSQSPYGKSYFLSVAHKTTNLACINTTKLKAFPVLIPPQDEQKDIVEACSNVDGKIRNATNKKAQLDDILRTLLHELMTANIRVHELEITT
jgi:type I restriction enzyme S subunit